MPLTQNGYIKRTASEIKQDLIDRLRLTIPDFTEQPADLQNDILDTSIEGILQYEDLLSTLFNAYSPSFSNADLFKKFAESVGLRQRYSFSAQVTLTFTGKYGDFVPKGTIVTSESGAEFITTENVVISTTSTANVLALSETEEIFQPGEINILKSVITEGISVTNLSASLKYIPTETAKELTARAQAKLRSARTGGKLYATQLLKGLPGVDSRLISFYNRESEQVINQQTMYVKGIEAVVGGGKDEVVALALYKSFLETAKLISLPSGQESSRTKEVVLYIYNNPVPIVFTRPKLLEIGLEMNINFSSALSTPLALQGITQDAVTAYINSLNVGIKVSKFALINITMPLLVDAGIPAHTIKAFEFRYKIGETGAYTNFSSDGFIPEVEHDCYCTLIEYGVVING